ncbi:MAG: hypothetical protein R3D97_09985 [Paracoccaceae bacterium]
MPTPPVMAAALATLAAATRASARASDAAARAARASARASDAATLAAATLAARASVATRASLAAARAAATIWDQLGNDTSIVDEGGDPFAEPLWSTPPPDWFQDADAKMRAIWTDAASEHWAFWTRWWMASCPVVRFPGICNAMSP